MKQEKQQEIALMRYGAIAPIIAGLDERYPSLLVGNSSNLNIITADAVMQAINDCELG